MLVSGYLVPRGSASTSSPPPACRIAQTQFEGWNATSISNQWVRLTIVPQLGGRLMQVQFGDHSYLFVNPKYRGKYISPADAAKSTRWINYGGDKLWPLPEGQGEGNWPGPLSDVLDDGEYRLTILDQTQRCAVRLEGQADPATGLQYSRDISVGNDSPQISFQAVMKNASNRPIQWSVQSVTQYDIADARNPTEYNRDFWAWTPLNPHTAYIDGYRVRSGLADDPSFTVQNVMFCLHWAPLENEVWLDADAGWLSVIDASTGYAMVERYHYDAASEYPGKASVIFYKNGAALEVDKDGHPAMRSSTPDVAPYYMEAELNSPLIRLSPGATYAMDTEWFPARASRNFHGVSGTGILCEPLVAQLTNHKLRLRGSFGVFFPGKLTAHVFDNEGAEKTTLPLADVDPLSVVTVAREFPISHSVARVSINLQDADGAPRGTLAEAVVERANAD